MEPRRDSCALGSENAEYEEKSDRVHPHGPLSPRQLVSHSPTHWITQEAHLDMIDAIDADMHARAGDAELAPWLLVLDCRAFKSSIRSEVAKHFAEFFLEAESNFEHVNLDSSTAVLRQLLLSFVHTAAQNADSPQHRAAGWRFIDWNEVEQRELLAEAKRLLETGEVVSTRHSRGASRARCRRRSQRQRARGARVWSHWQTITAATARTHPLVSRNQRHQRGQQLPLFEREQP